MGERCNRYTFKCTHVIFDMDGVVLDSECLNRLAINTVLATYGKQLTDLDDTKRKGMNSQECAKFIVETYKLPISFADYYAELKATYPKILPNCKLMPGIDRLLRHLHAHGIPCGLATASSEYSFSLKTSQHKELFSLFHHIVLGSSDTDVKYGKPAPDIFLVCSQRFDEKPEPRHCLVIEDSPNGVEAAQVAGMPCVMISDKKLPLIQAEKATFMINSLLEFQPEMFGFPSIN